MFDGVLAEGGKLDGFNLGAYGGLRTQYYDTSAPEDVVAGAFCETRPWEGGRVRLDYMYLEDEARLGSDQNDLVGLGLWHFLGEELTLEGEFTMLEGKSRDLRLRTLYTDLQSNASVQATFYKLFQTQSNEALELNPYFSSLLDYFPFQQIGLVASKGFRDDLTINVGLDHRWLEDSNQVGEFNHEFDRYYVNAMFIDLLTEGLDVTVTSDIWDDDQQDIQTWALDLTQRFEEDLRGSIGSYYSLYKYDLFQNSERDNVRTYYAKLRYEASSTLSFDVIFDYEDQRFGEFQTLTLATTWLF